MIYNLAVDNFLAALIPHLLFRLNYISDLTSQTVSKMRLVSFLLNRRLPPGRIYAG